MVERAIAAKLLATSYLFTLKISLSYSFKKQKDRDRKGKSSLILYYFSHTILWDYHTVRDWCAAIKSRWHANMDGWNFTRLHLKIKSHRLLSEGKTDCIKIILCPLDNTEEECWVHLHGQDKMHLRKSIIKCEFF